MESKQDNKLKTPNIDKQMSQILVRYILTIQWLGKITNKELMGTDQGSIREEIENRNWTWIGHTLRKPTTNVMTQALDWKPKEKENQADQEIDGGQ